MGKTGHAGIFAELIMIETVEGPRQVRVLHSERCFAIHNNIGRQEGYAITHTPSGKKLPLGEVKNFETIKVMAEIMGKEAPEWDGAGVPPKGFIEAVQKAAALTRPQDHIESGPPDYIGICPRMEPNGDETD